MFVITLLEEVGIGFDGGLDFLHCFVHRALELATAGILVAAAEEEARRHLVAREIIDAAETELHDAWMLCILVDKDTEAHAKHRQGDVDKSLGVAVLCLEEAPLFIGERHDGSVAVVQDLHVDVEQVALQTQPRLGSGPEDVAVDLVLVDAAGQQATDVLEDDRTVGVEGEGAGIAHHGGVEAGGFFQGDVIELARLGEQMADDFARSAHRGIGDNGLAEIGGVEMVVDEDAWRCALHDGLLQPCKPVGLVQVADNDEVGPVDGALYLFPVLLVRLDENTVGTRQPFQEVGKDVGHDDCCLPSFPLEVMLQGQ